MNEEFRSRVYTDRPAYADFDAPAKFQAIQSIIAKRRKDSTTMCFTETSDGSYRLRPLYYVSDADKAWYKEHYGIKYSDAYEVYGLTRTASAAPAGKSILLRRAKNDLW